MGKTLHRPVRQLKECKATGVLLPNERLKGICSRRNVSELEQHGILCLPTSASDPVGTTESQIQQCQDDIVESKLGAKAWMTTLFSPVKHSTKTTRKRKTAEDAPSAHFSSRSRLVEFSGMENQRRRLQKEGF